VWVKLDVVWVYASHTNGAGEALINWKLPGTYGATAYNAPTFTAYEGFLGNGTTQYIDCNWVPSVSGVNYVRNSASMIMYIRTNTALAGIHGTVVNADSKDVMLLQRSAGDIVYMRTNDAINASGANTNGSGMYINTRTASIVTKLYRNKTAIINGTVASTGVPTHSPYCLAYNDDDVAAGFRADQVSLYSFGGAMDQTSVNNFCDPFNQAMTALGTNVY